MLAAMARGVLQGDITKLAVDAIVNAANTSLLGGGGVDGAIHRAAGPALRDACIPLHGCATGRAKLTRGYALPARFVIHTVGPVWEGGDFDEEELLASCYETSLRLADRYHVRSIAFPAISAGVYGFPLARACDIAVRTVDAVVAQLRTRPDVTFVAYEPAIAEAYCRALGW